MKNIKQTPVQWVISHIEELISGTALILMISVTSANVIARYIFRSPIPWAEEFSTICLVWLTFIGAAVCYKRQAHLGMDFILARLPFKAKRIMQQIITVCLLVFFVYIAYLALTFAISTDKMTNYFKLNYAYLYCSVFLGFFSMAIYSAKFLIMSFKTPNRFDALFVNTEKEQEVTE